MRLVLYLERRSAKNFTLLFTLILSLNRTTTTTTLDQEDYYIIYYPKVEQSLVGIPHLAPATRKYLINSDCLLISTSNSSLYTQVSWSRR